MASKPINPLAPLNDLAYFFGSQSSTLPAFTAGEGIDKLNRPAIWRDLNDQVLSLLQRSTNGGALASTIITDLKALYDDPDTANAANQLLLKQAIGICAEDAGEFATPHTPAEMLDIEIGTPDPAKEKPNLVAFQIFPTDLSFSSRDAQTLDIFFNAIPNIEWSRCVPYFDLLVISAGKPVGTDGKPLTMSQHLFLSPNDALNEDDARLANALPEDVAADFEPGTVTVGGMELFTSPQTLVNADEEYFDPASGEEDDNPGLAILDKFRPFMTLKSFDVSVAPSFAMESFKTAKIALTLHDRSRLSQIAPLVRPDMYGGTELRVEYGWSHPDANNAPGTNPIAEFLNSLRCKEKYRITNSSFTFQDDGQVDVSISLAMKGSTELYTEVSTNGEGSAALMPSLKALTDELAALTKELRGAGSVLEDVGGSTVLAAGSSSSSALRINEETKQAITEFIADNKNSDPGSGLHNIVAKLGKIFGTDGTDGKIAEIDAGALAALQKKKDIINNKKDAFAAPFPMPSIARGKNGLSATAAGKCKNGYVSLGKLLMTYVGKPLQASGGFDEVQFVFYSFNSMAGFVRHHNIAQFPIKIENFNQAYEAKFKPTYSTSLQGFIGFLNSEFIQRESAEAYGLTSQLYEKGTGDDKGKMVIQKALQKNPTLLTSKKEDILAMAYPEGEPNQFRKPQLQMAFECVPVATTDPANSELTVTNETKTVLRIFVYDKSASAFDAQVALLSSLSQQNFGVVPSNAGVEAEADGTKGFGNQEFIAGHAARLAKVYEQATKEKIIEKLKSVTIQNNNPGGNVTPIEDVVYVKAKGGKLKEFLRKTVPSCIIGSTGNPVHTAGLSSMNDPVLASIRIAAAATANKGAIAGDADEGFPTFIQPTQLSVDMFGMPLLAYASDVFFDFNTNTTVDNFYVCTGVNHSFAPGQFKTTAKFTQVDGFEKFRSAMTDVKRQLVLGALNIKGEDLTEETTAGVTVNIP